MELVTTVRLSQAPAAAVVGHSTLFTEPTGEMMAGENYEWPISSSGQHQEGRETAGEVSPDVQGSSVWKVEDLGSKIPKDRESITDCLSSKGNLLAH